MQYPDTDPAFNNVPTRRLEMMTRDDLRTVCTFFGVNFRARERRPELLEKAIRARAMHVEELAAQQKLSLIAESY